jgi:hypothetical protein
MEYSLVIYRQVSVMHPMRAEGTLSCYVAPSALCSILRSIPVAKANRLVSIPEIGILSGGHLEIQMKQSGEMRRKNLIPKNTVQTESDHVTIILIHSSAFVSEGLRGL